MTLAAAARVAAWAGRDERRGWPAWIGFAALPTVGAVAVGLTAPLGQAVFVTAAALLLALLVAYVVALRSRPALLIAGFLVWLSIERFAVAALAAGLEPSELRVMLGYKELFFPLAAIVLARRIPRVWRDTPPALRVVDGLALAFGLLILLGVLLSPAPLMDRVIYARRLALLPLIYGVVRLLPWDVRGLRVLVGMVVGAAAAVALFGLAERFVLESVVWREWVPAAYYYHLSDLAGLSAQGSDFPRMGIPVAFYDFTAGVPQRRLVSTFLEATTLASFLAIGAIVAVAALRPRLFGWAVALVIAVAAVMTLGKAGWLILTLGSGYVVLASLIPRLRDPAWLASMGAGLIGALLVISLMLEASGSATGALAHFEGLRQGISAMLDAPLGHGIGIGGNFGVGTLAAESTFGVIMAQLGVVGLLVWSAWILSLAFATATFGGRLEGGERLLGPTLGASLIAFFGTAALTESAGGFLGNWIYALLPGALVTVVARQRSVEPDR